MLTMGATVLQQTTLDAPRELDSQAVEQGVRRVLTEEYAYRAVQHVSCPSGQPLNPSTQFSCTVRLKVDGKRRVPIVLVDDTGRYRVGAPRWPR